MAEKLPSFFQNRTIPDYLKYNVKTVPEKTAIIAWSGIENKKVRISYKNLNTVSNILATAYLNIGIKKGIEFQFLWITKKD